MSGNNGSNGGLRQRRIGRKETDEESRLWGESPLEYGLEEIKQLISTSSCNNFMLDDSKTGEMAMYY